MNPELPIVPSIRDATTTVEVRDDVGDVSPMSWARGEFRPTRIHITYRHFHDERGWQASGTVTGIRIRKDGSLGADDARTYMGWPADADPAWVTDFVRKHTPPEVFDLRQSDAVTYRLDAATRAEGDTDAGLADTATVLLPACAYLPTHIELTPTGELRFIATGTPGAGSFAQFTAAPAVKPGSWPVSYTAQSARTAAAQLLAYAHTYRTQVEGHRVASTHVDVRIVEPDARSSRASRWDLGMSGMNIRYVAPFTAFLDLPTPNHSRTLTHIAAEEWAGALLALARELDRARVVAEHAISADRAGVTDTAWLRGWLATVAPDLSAEQTQLADRLHGVLDDLDRHRAAERERITAVLAERRATPTTTD
jgi:hypothetical protein